MHGSRLPSQASARSPRDDLAGFPGTLQDLPAPEPLRTRCGINLAGLWSGSGVSGVFTSAATRADTHTSRRCGVSPEIPPTPIHTIRSAVRRSKHPSCSPFAIAARSCIINIRHTNNPLPDKHCCYDPMTPPTPARRLSPERSSVSHSQQRETRQKTRSHRQSTMARDHRNQCVLHASLMQRSVPLPPER